MGDEAVPLMRGVYMEEGPTRKRVLAVGGHGQRVGLWQIFNGDDPREVVAMARRHLDREDPPTIRFQRAA